MLLIINENTKHTSDIKPMTSRVMHRSEGGATLIRVKIIQRLRHCRRRRRRHHLQKRRLAFYLGFLPYYSIINWVL